MSQKKKTSKSFSPYTIHSLPDGSYQFFTTSNIEYKCLLSISSNSFIDFQLDVQPFDFSFYPLNNGRAPEDKRINATIAKLLNDILDNDTNTIITFICDNRDDKAKKRLKLFKKWFKSQNTDNNRVALLIEFDELFYAGVILNNTHPELPQIRLNLEEEKINFNNEKDDLFDWDEIE